MNFLFNQITKSAEPNFVALLAFSNPAPQRFFLPFALPLKSAEAFSPPPFPLGGLASRADIKLQEKGFFTLGYSPRWQKLYQTSLTRIWLNGL